MKLHDARQEGQVLERSCVRRRAGNGAHADVKLPFDQNLSRRLVGMFSVEIPRARTSASAIEIDEVLRNVTEEIARFGADADERLFRCSEESRTDDQDLRSSSIWSNLVVVDQLRIVIRWYCGVPTTLLNRLWERRAASRSK